MSPVSEDASPLALAAARFADAPALIHGKETIPYGEHLGRVRRTAAALMESGLKPREVLAIRAHPGIETITLLMACLELGIIACPIDPKLPDRPLRDALDRVGAKRLVSEVDEAPVVGMPVTRPGEWMPATGAHRLAHVKYRPNRPGMLVFTSGSTGVPKAALLTHGNFWESALRSNRNIPLGPGKRWVLSLPLHHVSGLGVLFRCAAAGACVIIPGREQPLHDAIAWYGGTHVSLVPAQLRRMLASKPGRKALARLDAALLGGSGIPSQLLEEAHAAGVPVHTSYGLTEMASQAATTPPKAALGMLLLGAPVLEPGTVRIGEGGVIEVCGATRFAGYWERGEVVEPFDEGGWFRTGDRGELTDDGLLIVHGRVDNMFISGGENIQPEEIEAALTGLEGIAQAIVVPIPDETYGARPVAFIHTGDDGAPIPPGLREHLLAQLPTFKIPNAFHPWPVDLAAPGLKPNRPAFQQRAEELAGGLE